MTAFVFAPPTSWRSDCHPCPTNLRSIRTLRPPPFRARPSLVQRRPSGQRVSPHRRLRQRRERLLCLRRGLRWVGFLQLSPRTPPHRSRASIGGRLLCCPYGLR